jgi:hypothetical protein
LKKSGVPSLVKLENDVLIGSISPIIRSVYFGQYDFPFILEIPCHPSEASLRIYKDMMNLVASSRDRFEIFMKLEKFYPQQADRLRNYFIEYSDNFFILFKKTIKYACENHSTTPEDLEIFIKSMVNELDLKINDIQLNQVAEAVLIFSNKEL